MSARCLCYLLRGKSLYTSEKRTRPRAFVPDGLLPLFGQRRVFLILLPTMLTCFLVAAFNPDHFAARLAAAVAHTCFSMGCAYALEWGHGQYPVLWTSWALVALPTPYAVAAARAAVTYLYVMAGLAKLCVPAAPSEYLDARSMRLLFSKDGVNPRFDGAWAALARAVIRAPALLRAITMITLVLELLVVPATFVLPAGARRAIALGCLAFHAGIWLCFSTTAGMMFFQLAGVRG